MSSFSLGKKLLPGRKAWKSFTSILERKLHKLKRSKTIKKITSKLNTTLTAVLRYCQSIQPFIRRRRQALTRSHATLSDQDRRHHHNNKLLKSFAPVYIDELYVEPASVHIKPAGTSKLVNKLVTISDAIVMTGQTSRTQEMKLLNRKVGEKSRTKAASDLWEASASVLPHMRGVDERADEFIANFRQDMKLQRERSLVEFHEMLTRGV